MKKLSGGRAWRGGHVKYVKQARKCDEGRGKFDKVRLEWEDGEGEGEDERREEEEESRGKEVFVLVVGVLDVFFFGFAENERKKADQRFKSGYMFFLTRFDAVIIKQELRCLLLQFIYLFLLAIPYPTVKHLQY